MDNIYYIHHFMYCSHISIDLRFSYGYYQLPEIDFRTFAKKIVKMNPFYVGTVANYNASSLAQAAAERDRASAVCSPAQIKKIEEANAIPGLYNVDELAPGLKTAPDTLSRGLFDLDAEIRELYKKVYTSCYNAARQDEESCKVDKQKLADRFSRFKGLLNFAVDLFNECHYFYIKKLSMSNFITSKMSNEDYKKIQSHSTFINTYHVNKLWSPHGITVDKDKDVQEAYGKVSSHERSRAFSGAAFQYAEKHLYYA